MVSWFQVLSSTNNTSMMSTFNMSTNSMPPIIRNATDSVVFWGFHIFYHLLSRSGEFYQFFLNYLYIPNDINISIIFHKTNRKWRKVPLVLWCFTPLSTLFQLYRGGQFYWWRKLEYPETTIDLSQVTDKHYHIMCVSSTTTLSEVWNQKVSGYRHWLHR